ncbi:choice-of-anchor G family protein [Solicola gregarius]|uniref:Choice-of-anchor G family protein n=1 Tax=Solicola gregarius TaxID=2908642 RepID=A0AA46TM58_9ACTN|nr:choice-of-anchor G family protein [Solicola gregarius]UYM07457.1 choice-of-anchor G family protein [Solicola gregarius]
MSALMAGACLTAAPAMADDHSTARARFLSADIASVDLGPLAALKGVTAHQRGGRTVTKTNRLEGSLLGNLIPLKKYAKWLEFGDAVTIGAVTQFAQAKPNGRSRAYAGLVSSSGPIGDNGGHRVPTSATVNLSKLMAGRVPDFVTDQVKNLHVGFRGLTAVGAMDAKRAVAPASSCRNLDHPKHCLGYQLGNVSVGARFPALKDFYASLGPIWSAFDGRSRPIAQICNTMLAPIPQVKPACDTLRNNPFMDVSIKPPNADRLVDVFRRAGRHHGLYIDPTRGTVRLDADRFLAGMGIDVNRLGQGTNVVSYVTEAIDTGIAPALNSTAQRVIDEVVRELEKSAITIKPVGSAPVTVQLSDLSPLYQPLVYALKAAVMHGIYEGVGQLTNQIMPALREADAYGDRVQILANIQDRTAGGAYRVTALRVRINDQEALPGNIDLAKVAVGPNGR